MVIVYTLGKGSSWNDNELRISIRSMVKNTPVERIIIVGHKPEFIQNVTHIPFPDGPRKALNIHLKTHAACLEVEEFVQAADDHFVLKPTNFENYYHGGLIKEKKFHGKYAIATANTRKELPGGLFYNLHIPMKMKSRRYMEIMSLYDWENKDFLIKSLYGNNEQVGGERISDCKVRDFLRRPAIEKYVENRTFLSVSDSGLSHDMRKFLMDSFPEKSIYEV